MLSNAVEALYIFDQHNESILEHVYRSRPASARVVLPLYLAHPTPRPSLIYLPNINPPTVLFSVTHNNLLILSPVSTETEPLFVLEFLHRVIDVLEEFIGDPLLATKIEGNYDVVAQLLGEMCDAGSVCNTEPNALRDDVDVSGFLGKLLGGVGLPGSSPALLPSGGLKQQLSLNPTSNGPAIPWRRANVRHTSNELYVDIVETLSVTLAPSGRPLAAFANGSIVFTSKISGVPDLLLTLSASGGKLGMEKAIELPVFHPCVRLARWKERPGELSFVPPDGKFMLAGYEVNLMPSNLDLQSWSNTNLQLPVSIEVSKSLGPTGADFEVRLILSSIFPGASTSAPVSRPNLGTRGSGRSTPIFGSSASGPTLQDVVVTIPIPKAVRNITDLRASRGEAYFTPADNVIEWRVPTKDAAAAGSATLRCTIVGPLSEDDEDGANGFSFDAANGDYDYKEETYQSSASDTPKKSSAKEQNQSRDQRKIEHNAPLMPSSASVSFSVKGWLASGIRVDGLVLDTRKSRGLGKGVKPYKGVKYLTTINAMPAAEKAILHRHDGLAPIFELLKEKYQFKTPLNSTWSSLLVWDGESETAMETLLRFETKYSRQNGCDQSSSWAPSACLWGEKFVGGGTALNEFLYWREDDEIIRFLDIHKPCNIDKADYMETALHIAAREGRFKLVKVLVERYHAIVDVPDYIGKTPLDVAWDELKARHEGKYPGKTELPMVIKYLESIKPDDSYRSRQTPTPYAKRDGHPESDQTAAKRQDGRVISAGLDP